MGLMDSIDSILDISIGTLSLMKVLSVIAVFLACLIAIKVVLGIFDRVQERSKIDNTLKSFMRSGIKTGLWIIAIIIIVDKLGIQASPFVAVLSVAGLALSLSIQSILSNLFSGITTLTTKPFSSGDYVEFDEVSGTVSEVGLFYTTMTTVDNKTIYIPNSQVASAKIVNYSKQKNRRLDLTFRVSYDSPTETVKKALTDAIKADRRILDDPAPFVGLLSYKESSIEYVLRAWTSKEDFWDVHFALNEGIRELFEKRGINMTYEHVNVHIVNDYSRKTQSSGD